MAYQYFYSWATNQRRLKPVNVSGKTIKGELRVRQKGQSVTVLSYLCRPDASDEQTLVTSITITDPRTGECIASIDLESDK